jgi:glycosyltransferase involved in cell wall biosynthesis
MIGFAGRFVEEKGFDILFSAISKVIERLPHARFLFAGATHMPYENFFDKHLALYEKIKKYIEFKGLLDDKKLLEFYRLADFIVIPSRSDCFNLVQAEAMLAGTPCVTSNIPGLRFMVKETGFGVLFRKEDSDDLADKIFYAIEHKNKIMVSYTNVLKVLNNTSNAAKIREFITV